MNLMEIMMNLKTHEAVASNLNMQLPAMQIIRKVPRSYRCYSLPESIDLSQIPRAQEALAERMASFLAVEHLTPHVMVIAPGVWMCTYWHGGKRRHRLSTYEDEGMGALWYRPRLTASLVFDGIGKMVLISLPKEAPEGVPMDALACLQPKGASPLMSLMPLGFSLVPVLGLPFELCRPLSPSAPWRALQLKSVIWQEAGKLAARMAMQWPRDGWADFHITPIAQMPERIASATMRICLDARRAYGILLEPGTQTVKVSLCEAVFPAVRALLTHALVRTAS